MPANDEQRSLRVLAQRLGKSSTIVARWSREDGWPRRVASYDNHIDQRKRAALGRELESTVRGAAQHLAGARALIGQSVTAVLRHIAAENEQGRDPFADWDLREKMCAAATLVKALPAVVQAERLVAGLSSVNLAGHDGGAVKAEATVRAESMSRAEAEAYLLGREEDRGARQDPE
jgi:hypothetical protein